MRGPFARSLRSPSQRRIRGGGWQGGGGGSRGAGGGQLGSAPRPREAILPPGPSEAPAALHVPNPPPPSPLWGPLPDARRTRRGVGKDGAGGGRERGGCGARPRLPRARSSGRCGGGGGGCGPRGPRAGGVGTAGRGGRGEGEGGEPLPILGRSRRRRRPAVGESKVVAGRHFGIFPQPAGHCGGHGESGPMAGGQP